MKSNRTAVIALAVFVILLGIAAWQAANAQNQKMRAEEQETEIAKLRDELRQCSGPRPSRVRQVQTPVQHTPPPPPSDSPAPSSKTEPDIKTKDRFITVTAKCQAAEEAYAQIRTSSAEQGQSPHPDLMTAFSRMKIALDSAGREMDEGRIGEARDSLDVAEASANKVLRAAGGR